MRLKENKKSNGFQDVPVDTDTKILHEELLIIKGIQVLKQDWYWEGIKASSLILRNNDAEQLTDEELKKLVDKDEDKTTLKRSDRYTFVNYGFKII